MCMGGGSPSKPAKLPEAPVMPTALPGSLAGDDKRRRAAAGAGGTILTGPQGLTSSANTAQKTLLGG